MSLSSMMLGICRFLRGRCSSSGTPQCRRSTCASVRLSPLDRLSACGLRARSARPPVRCSVSVVAYPSTCFLARACVSPVLPIASWQGGQAPDPRPRDSAPCRMCRRSGAHRLRHLSGQDMIVLLCSRRPSFRDACHHEWKTADVATQAVHAIASCQGDGVEFAGVHGGKATAHGPLNPKRRLPLGVALARPLGCALLAAPRILPTRRWHAMGRRPLAFRTPHWAVGRHKAHVVHGWAGGWAGGIGRRRVRQQAGGRPWCAARL